MRGPSRNLAADKSPRHGVKPATVALLVGQCINGIQPGRATGGRISKENADSGGEEKDNQIDLRIEFKWHFDDFRQAATKPQR